MKRATDAALASYVATYPAVDPPPSDTILAFAFCYLASHYGLGLVPKSLVNVTMEFLEANEVRLADAVERGAA
jgi:hypothetical protein